MSGVFSFLLPTPSSPFPHSVIVYELFPAPDEIGATADRYILAEAVNRLRPEFKEVVLLFYYQGFSVAEISEMLGIAEGTVSSRLSRARTKLQEELKGDESC